MMTCKTVATELASGSIDDASLMRKVSTWLHLLMCHHCRTFARQLARLGRAARRAAGFYESEPGPDFEVRLVEAIAKAPRAQSGPSST